MQRGFCYFVFYPIEIFPMVCADNDFAVWRQARGKHCQKFCAQQTTFFVFCLGPGVGVQNPYLFKFAIGVAQKIAHTRMFLYSSRIAFDSFVIADSRDATPFINGSAPIIIFAGVCWAISRKCSPAPNPISRILPVFSGMFFGKIVGKTVSINTVWRADNFLP